MFHWGSTRYRKGKGAYYKILDLTKPEDLQFLMDSARQEAINLCLLHFARQCGTCTSARKRKLPSEVQAKLKDAGITPPQQLRSEQFPMGLPGIAGSDLHKVEQANKLYFATRDLALLAISLGIRVAMKNQTNSLFWKTGSYPRTFASASGTLQYFSQLHDGRWKTDTNNAVVQWIDNLFV